MKAVRLPQYCDKPVATWTANTHLTSRGEADTEDNGPIGLSDPLARELYVTDDLRRQAAGGSEITNAEEAWASSILRVHEPIHAGLSDRFSHFYGHSRLNSFVISLRLVHEGPYLRRSQFWNELLYPLLRGTWNRLQLTELTQEASALRAQREFLKRFNHPSRDQSWRENVNRTRWHRIIDHFLQEGVVPKSKNGRPAGDFITHALGDWLGEQVTTSTDDSIWKIDPLSIAFRIQQIGSADERRRESKTDTSDIEKWETENWGSVAPDSVLICATSLSDDELAGLSAESQVILLCEEIEKTYNISVNAFVEGETSPTIGLNHSPIEQISTRDALTQWRERQYRSFVDVESWYTLPLWAVTYPGIQDNLKPTLWELLEGIAADTVQQDGKSTQRLWLETRYKGMVGSKILAMAVQIWHLRDYILMPLVRSVQRNTTVRTRPHLSVARMIANETIPSRTTLGKLKSSNMLQNKEMIMRRNHRLHEQTPTLRERSKELFDALEKLGRAIYQDDERTISSFY